MIRPGLVRDIMQTSRLCRLHCSMQKTMVKTDFLLKRGMKSKGKKKGNPAKLVPVTDRVLEYFDMYYGPRYKKLWPSIRISLLSEKKTTAVINNYAGDSKYLKEFIDRGAYDVIQLARVKQKKMLGIVDELATNDTNASSSTLADTADDLNNTNAVLDTYEPETDSPETDKASEAQVIINSEDFRKDLDVFVSEKSLYYDSVDSKDTEDDVELKNEDEEDVKAEFTALNDKVEIVKPKPLSLLDVELKNEDEEDVETEFTALNNKVEIVKPKPLSLPEHLKQFAFPAGDISHFPDVKGNKEGQLYFYMIDGASVLPVIALDLEKDDKVLDLCAAPGGKALTALQTGLPDSLHCNDVTVRRLGKLRNFIGFCVPKDRQKNIVVGQKDGRLFESPVFNKVLVDVPCNTDRHYLLTAENNLFSRPRANERQEMPKLQKQLLVSGIKSCIPGGNIVYSTCTLAPSQNDGTVQQALDEIVQTTDIKVVVEDLQEMVDIFGDTFKFSEGSRFGKLVIPSLLSNYGPMYICRLKRIS